LFHFHEIGIIHEYMGVMSQAVSIIRVELQSEGGDPAVMQSPQNASVKIDRQGVVPPLYRITARNIAPAGCSPGGDTVEQMAPERAV